MLEEFATLGHMDFMERAAAYFPSFGVKPWFVLQDITQLKTHYHGWQSILGNAGVVQLFGNGDGDSVRYATERMGKLIEPWELERHSRASAITSCCCSKAARRPRSNAYRMTMSSGSLSASNAIASSDAAPPPIPSRRPHNCSIASSRSCASRSGVRSLVSSLLTVA
jgi:hypothetical protein